MADRITIARPYAKAAFRAATEAGQLPRWATVLERAAAAVQDARVAALIGNPKVTPAQLAELVTAVAGESVDQGARNLLLLLANNRRLAFLPEIAALFQLFKDEADQVVDVQITSAAPMVEAEQQQLAAALARRFARKVRVNTDVDPGLIGGAVVRAGDTVIDGSIKSRLERLAFELTA